MRAIFRIYRKYHRGISESLTTLAAAQTRFRDVVGIRFPDAKPRGDAGDVFG
jgi:hypothetical protein